MLDFMLRTPNGDQSKDPYQQLEKKYTKLESEHKNLQEELDGLSQHFIEVASVNTDLDSDLKKARSANTKLSEVLALLLDYARQQEWVFPAHIRTLLPQDETLIHKAALQKVPYGNSPAEYAFNILYFLSLPKLERLQLGSKLFQLGKEVRPEDFAELNNVVKELHEFLSLLYEDDMHIEPEYPYLRACVPKRSTNPRSKWVVVMNNAMNFFPIYTRVTVMREQLEIYCSNRSLNAFTSVLYLEAERLTKNRNEPEKYRIRAEYDSETGTFYLEKDLLHSWEIANFGVCTYMADYHVNNLVMDNNPPYTDGMRGIVQILWTGKCIYESAED